MKQHTNTGDACNWTTTKISTPVRSFWTADVVASAQRQWVACHSVHRATSAKWQQCPRPANLISISTLTEIPFQSHWALCWFINKSECSVAWSRPISTTTGQARTCPRQSSAVIGWFKIARWKVIDPTSADKFPVALDLFYNFEFICVLAFASPDKISCRKSWHSCVFSGENSKALGSVNHQTIKVKRCHQIVSSLS